MDLQMVNNYSKEFIKGILSMNITIVKIVKYLWTYYWKGIKYLIENFFALPNYCEYYQDIKWNNIYGTDLSASLIGILCILSLSFTFLSFILS